MPSSCSPGHGLAGNDLPVEDGLVERHGDVVLGLEANRGLELGRVVDARQAQRAHCHALVGDAEPDVLRKLVRGEQLLDRARELVGLVDLAVPEHAGGERRHAVGSDGRPSVRAKLGGGDARGLDVEADDALWLALSCRDHGGAEAGLASRTVNRPDRRLT